MHTMFRALFLILYFNLQGAVLTLLKEGIAVFCIFGKNDSVKF